LNVQDKDGQTAFHLACTNGHLNVVEIFMKKSYLLGIDLTIQDFHGSTGFHLACQNETAEIIMKNHIYDLNINARDNLGQTPFHNACLFRNYKVAKWMMDSATQLKIDFNTQNYYGNTALHLACLANSSKIVQLLLKILLEHNIDWNIRNNNGSTAFHLACERNHFEIAELLIKSHKYSIDLITVSNFLNARDNMGCTGFHYACVKGCKNIVEIILNKSEDVFFDLSDQNGCFQFANWVQILINNFELYRDWYGNMFNQGFDRPDIFEHLILLFWTPWYYQAYSFLQN
jgi:ankyrin